MKRIFLITLSLIILTLFAGCAKPEESADAGDEDLSVANFSITGLGLQSITDFPVLPTTVHFETVGDTYPKKQGNTYYTPDYDSKSYLHSDLFLEILKRDGYYNQDGEIVQTYPTENFLRIYNITPKSVFNGLTDVEIFYVKNRGGCFLMKDEKIYRYDYCGYHEQLHLWDYDGNGVKDLVSYHSFGSGVLYHGVSVLDLSSMENHDIISRPDSITPGFFFGFRNDIIYIDGKELTYSNGEFYCEAFESDSED